ncbi:MAG: InlB B-repeat-containing protein, partial [Lachnospiraceae bacterium]|nr:InlB B-repeat-containing protein [Lachnospiraceae bacterium]
MASRSTTVTSLDELNTAIANAGDGDTVTVSGNIPGIVNIAGKKITLTGGTLQALNISESSEVTLENITIDANKIGNGTADKGRSAVILKDSKLYLKEGCIIENAEAYIDNRAFPAGGGICSQNSYLEMSDGAIIRNNSTQNNGSRYGGGGIALLKNSKLIMNGGTITGNKAKPTRKSRDTGGGVHIDTSEAEFRGGLIENNEAPDGGGISIGTGQAYFAGVEVSGNRAIGGGGLYDGAGGGICMGTILTEDSYATVTVAGMTKIINNSALLEGGGISARYTLNLFGGTVSGNSCSSRGGGIYSQYETDYLTVLNLSGNPQVTGNSSNGVDNNLELIEVGYTGRMVGDFTGKIGITKSPESPLDGPLDAIVNAGFDPIESMTQGMEKNPDANFFSDNPDYYTLLVEEGTNHKIVITAPKVTLDPRGGTLDAGTTNPFYTPYNKPTSAPADPTLLGYKFIGWSTDPHGEFFDFEHTAVNNDLTLYARYDPEVYLIHYEANDGSGLVTQQPHDPTKDATILDNPFTRAGYTFTGWNTQEDGNGTAYAASTVISPLGYQDLTLYAQWELTKYKVTFDSMGGSTVGEMDVFENDIITEPAIPTKEGYTFDGWYKEETLVSVWDFAKDKVTTDTTLYAKWIEKEYTVKYDTNGGNPAAITDKTNVKFNDTGLRPADDPTRTGYTFEGWEVDGKKVTDVTAYKALVADDSVKSVTLTAQWKEKEYTVKYDSNGGNPVTIADKEHVKFWEADLLPADTMTKPGYTFGGWNYKTLPVSDTSKYSDFAADDKVKEITLVAQWIPKQYKVNYDVNGGEPDNYPSETVGFEAVVPIPVNAPTRIGYDFKGWLKDATKIDGTSVTYDSLVADDTVSEITLAAQWAEKSYTVKFELKPGERGGTLAGNTADQSVKYNQHSTAGADVSVSVDSVFLGWSYSYTPVGSTTPISGTVMDYTTVPILNDVTFIANFAKVPFVSGISTNGYVSVEKGGAPTDAGTETITKIEYDLTDTLPGEAGFKFEGVLHYHIDE